MYYIFFLTTLCVLFGKGSSQCSFGFVYNGTHCEECGTTDFIQNTKIVGGIVANANSWPWAVFIIQNVKVKYTFNDGNTYIITTGFECGGTLVGRDTVVSAAHCINEEFDYTYKGLTYTIPIAPNSYYRTWGSMFTVYLGGHNVSQVPATVTPPMISRNVLSVIIHPSYNPSNQLNDISIFKLSVPVEFNSFIKPACLPQNSDTNFPKPFDSVVAIGWGTTSEGGTVSSLLRNVLLTVYNSSYCSLVYPSFTKQWLSQICCGEYAGGKDTCQGDSGGGIFLTNTTTGKSRRILSGITSYGYGCARSTYPGIYTRVSYYLTWINSYMAVTTSTTITNTVFTTTKPVTTNYYLYYLLLLLPFSCCLLITILCCISKLKKNQTAQVHVVDTSSYPSQPFNYMNTPIESIQTNDAEPKYYQETSQVEAVLPTNQSKSDALPPIESHENIRSAWEPEDKPQEVITTQKNELPGDSINPLSVKKKPILDPVILQRDKVEVINENDDGGENVIESKEEENATNVEQPQKKKRKNKRKRRDGQMGTNDIKLFQ